MQIHLLWKISVVHHWTKFKKVVFIPMCAVFYRRELIVILYSSVGPVLVFNNYFSSYSCNLSKWEKKSGSVYSEGCSSYQLWHQYISILLICASMAPLWLQALLSTVWIGCLVAAYYLLIIPIILGYYKRWEAYNLNITINNITSV
jgi:hypothetical protein